MRLTLLLSVVIAAATISKGGQVVLTSDPPGSTIFAGGKQLGTTPLTADLPPGPTEVTSRFGTLEPVVQTLTLDDAQVVAFRFKHSYGTLIVSSDRADATLAIDGTNFGHPPALVFLTPGTHKVFVAATNQRTGQNKECGCSRGPTCERRDSFHWIECRDGHERSESNRECESNESLEFAHGAAGKDKPKAEAKSTINGVAGATLGATAG
jgi:hypothetical protein